MLFAAFSGFGYMLVAPSSAATLTTQNVAFCNGELLDFYAPRVRKYAKTPLIIYVHGGALVTGDKLDDATQINFLTQLQDRGYALAAINYHLLTEAPNTTAPIDDTLCAVRWARANAAALGIDPDRVGMFGWSAGAQLVALADTLPPGSAANKGALLNYSSRPQATVALAGVYDFNWELANPLSQVVDARNKILAKIYQGMGPTELQPYNQLSADDPPLMLIHGMNDIMVNPVHTTRMEARAVQVGARHQVIRVNGGDHGLRPNDNSMSPTQAQVNASIAAFFDSNLRISSAPLYTAATDKPAPAPAAKPAVKPPVAAAPSPTPPASTNSTDSAASAGDSESVDVDSQATINDVFNDSMGEVAATKTKRTTGWIFILLGVVAAIVGGLYWLKRRRAASAVNTDYDGW